ncbi:MAG: TOMM precursor leader peptide-binding protein [Myxococcales bacterium]|nr:TOMM precursor leader peptide-binding protein [Myxococcales bacterium]MDD9969064.1 TOMM precursor leader peptide-binding protein [Myxococcales bacterium]
MRSRLEFEHIPVLAPARQSQWLEGDRVLLIGERDQWVLSGRHICEVVRRLDGQRCKAEIIDEVGALVGDLAALSAFHELEEQGHLVEFFPDVRSGSSVLWNALGFDPRAAISRTERAMVRLCAAGDAVTAGIIAEARESLQSAGLTSVPDVDRGPSKGGGQAACASLWVVDDYLHDTLRTANQVHSDTPAPWCLVKPFGTIAWAGPILAPGRGPCWACLAHALAHNQPLRHAISPHMQSSALHAGGALPVTRRLAFDLVSFALARVLADSDRDDPLYNHILSVDLRSLETTRHRVVRRPQCPCCGNPGWMGEQASRALELSARTKRQPHDGGYRQALANETFERLKHLTSPLIGPVNFVDPMPVRHCGLKAVYVSGYSVSPAVGQNPAECLRVCAGKGQSHDQARASALCEALERKSGQYQGDEARLVASYAELGNRALHPRTLLGFSERQYSKCTPRDGAALDASRSVPRPLGDDQQISWTPAWPLVGGECRYVPFSYCFAEAPTDMGVEFCRPSGNGVAGGTCLEEAILQACLELIERDAVSIWWYNRIARPAIDLDDLGSLDAAAGSYTRHLLADYKTRGLDVWVLDLTHDLGTPTCVAVSRPAQGPRGVFGLGFGCHLDPAIAIVRALTELNQIGDGLHPVSGRPLIGFERLPDKRFLFPSEQQATMPTALPHFDGPDLLADVMECRRRLEQAGLEMLVVSKTRPDYDLEVAQVIVPGLRHFWPRFGPGRLYDTPVELGWLPEPNPESGLNPVPMWL